MAANRKTGNNGSSSGRRNNARKGNENFSENSRAINNQRENATEIQQMKRPPKPKR
jgi:hypothetical protein